MREEVALKINLPESRVQVRPDRDELIAAAAARLGLWSGSERSERAVSGSRGLRPGALRPLLQPDDRF